jgi:transposase-like protein
MEAINVYMKYDCSVCATIHELGYPSPNMLRRWYKEYLENGFIHTNYQKKSKFTKDQKETAVSHYFNHGKCYARTIRKLGYPNRTTLREWCNEVTPSTRKLRKNHINYTREQKEKAVFSLLQREEPAEKLANKIGVERGM